MTENSNNRNNNCISFILHDSKNTTTTIHISFNFNTFCLEGNFKSFFQIKLDKKEQEDLFLKICNSKKLTSEMLSWLLSLKIFKELGVSENLFIFENLCYHGNSKTLRLLYGCIGPRLILSQYKQQQFFVNMCRTFGTSVPQILTWLLSLKIFKDVDIHALNDRAFQVACEHGCIEVVKWFLGLRGKQKINKNAINNEGFVSACKKGHYEVVKYLLSLNDHRRIEYKLVIEGFKGACYFNSLNTVELLLSLKCNRRINDAKLIGEVLKGVCCHGHEEIVNLLLNLEQDQQINDLVMIGEALLCACNRGHFEVAQMFTQLQLDNYN